MNYDVSLNISRYFCIQTVIGIEVAFSFEISLAAADVKRQYR